MQSCLMFTKLFTVQCHTSLPTLIFIVTMMTMLVDIFTRIHISFDISRYSKRPTTGQTILMKHKLRREKKESSFIYRLSESENENCNPRAVFACRHNMIFVIQIKSFARENKKYMDASRVRAYNRAFKRVFFLSTWQPALKLSNEEATFHFDMMLLSLPHSLSIQCTYPQTCSFKWINL